MYVLIYVGIIVLFIYRCVCVYFRLYRTAVYTYIFCIVEFRKFTENVTARTRYRLDACSSRFTL